MTINPHRGEFEVEIAGVTYTSRWTLDLLARLETAIGARSLPDIARRFAEPASSDIAAIISTVTSGQLSVEQVRDLPLHDVMAAMPAIGAAFEKAFTAPEDGKSTGKKPAKSRSPGETGSASASA